MQATLTDTELQALAIKILPLLPERQEKQAYTFAEIAKSLSVSTQTVRRKAANGDFGKLLIDGEIKRVTKSGMENYIRLHKGR